jgi:hypothetical protein
MLKTRLSKNEKIHDIIGLSAGAIAKEDTSDCCKGMFHML